MNKVYNRIGKEYNSTRRADPLLLDNLIRLLSPEKGKSYLDMGCGTGNYTIELMNRGFDFMGMDPSELMIETARHRCPGGDWRQVSAENTGLEDSSIDGITATLTIHHWKVKNKAFRELKRILKPDGKMLLFTQTPEQMQGCWLKEYFPKMMSDSINTMNALDEINRFAQNAGFSISKTEIYSIHPELEDQFLYCGKHNPELYFDENIRRGISSFSLISNKEEVEAGLHKLRNDIDTGKIKEIIRSYQNDLGDYIYILFS